MSRNKSRFLLFVGLVLLVTAGFVTTLQTKALSEEGCTAPACHAALLKAKTVHPVAQACDSCHEQVSKPHPQKGKKTFKLIQDVPALCTMCHAAFGTKKHIHPPVKDGMCTFCHNPHSANEPKLLAQPVKELCTSCHPDKLQFNYLHGPTSAGDCTVCHNPHESDNSSLTVKEGVDLCLTCHADMQDILKKKDVHPALLSGCTACHNPHGGPYRRMLSAEGKNLCFQCHPDIGEKVEKSKVVHGPIQSERGCASCHSPHSSDNEKLLIRSGKDLCLGCHTDIIKKNQTVLHGPILAGKCTPCHDPHGSANQKLLVKEFPEDTYISYNDKEFQLCFSCHNRDLLKFPDTSFATGFRDGERNLHYLHVNRAEKGRNCKECHAIHATTNPKMIAEKVSFGNWAFSLKYVKTPTGGSCTPGCHKTYNYDRNTPGQSPEAAKPVAEQQKK